LSHGLYYRSRAKASGARQWALLHGGGGNWNQVSGGGGGSRNQSSGTWHRAYLISSGREASWRCLHSHNPCIWQAAQCLRGRHFVAGQAHVVLSGCGGAHGITNALLDCAIKGIAVTASNASSGKLVGLAVIDGLVAIPLANRLWVAALDLIGHEANVGLLAVITLVLEGVDWQTLFSLTNSLNIMLESAVGQSSKERNGF
jgi:hypothetical protein